MAIDFKAAQEAGPWRTAQRTIEAWSRDGSTWAAAGRLPL